MLVVSYCKNLVFFFVIPLIITQRKPLIICWQTDRQMDIINPEFYFCQSVLLWTPNAYRIMLMRIFTPCLIFQCVFTNFQCVNTLLRALSVALKYGSEEASDVTNPCCNNAGKFNWIYLYVEWLKKMNANLRLDLTDMTLVQSLETYIVNKYFKHFRDPMK